MEIIENRNEAEINMELLKELLLTFGNNLSGPQRTLLSEIIFNGRTYVEMKRTLGLTTRKQQVLLKKALKNLFGFIGMANEDLIVFNNLVSDRAKSKNVQPKFIDPADPKIKSRGEFKKMFLN